MQRIDESGAHARAAQGGRTKAAWITIARGGSWEGGREERLRVSEALGGERLLAARTHSVCLPCCGARGAAPASGARTGTCASGGQEGGDSGTGAAQEGG